MVRVSVVVCIICVHIFSLNAPVFASVDDGPVIGAVVFEGVTVFTPDHLGPVYQSTIGTRLTPQARSQLASNVRQLYDERGFSSPR